MRRTTVALFLSVAGVVASAHDFEADGICYNIVSPKDLTCEVTSKSDGGVYVGEISIPKSVVYGAMTYSVVGIGYQAFSDCAGLTQVSIPESVTAIGDYAFYGCSGLTQVSIPNSVTSMGRKTFMYCYGLTRITISESVPTIGEDTFWSCTGLMEVTIPNGVTTIEESAFEGCSGLAQVTLGECVTTIGPNAFQQCAALAEIDIPDNVLVVDEDAFSECTALTKATIGNGVTFIGDGAFEYCDALTQVTIGSSVAAIDRGAFSDCVGLASITSLNPEPPACSSYVFYNVSKSTCVLYVPAGAAEAYSTASQWQAFLNIVEMDADAVEGIVAGGVQAGTTERYTLDGRRLSVPRRGVNILRRPDGTVGKVLAR